jgi:hypothetical protein
MAVVSIDGLILSSPPRQSPALTATFIGNMAFAVTDGTTTLYTDFPYESGYSGYMTYDFDAVPKAKDSLCLITHGTATTSTPGSWRDELPRHRPADAPRGCPPTA